MGREGAGVVTRQLEMQHLSEFSTRRRRKKVMSERPANEARVKVLSFELSSTLEELRQKIFLCSSRTERKISAPFLNFVPMRAQTSGFTDKMRYLFILHTRSGSSIQPDIPHLKRAFDRCPPWWIVVTRWSASDFRRIASDGK